jgi:hypothetical protein
MYVQRAAQSLLLVITLRDRSSAAGRKRRIRQAELDSVVLPTAIRHGYRLYLGVAVEKQRDD